MTSRRAAHTRRILLRASWRGEGAPSEARALHLTIRPGARGIHLLSAVGRLPGGEGTWRLARTGQAIHPDVDLAELDLVSGDDLVCTCIPPEDAGREVVRVAEVSQPDERPRAGPWHGEWALEPGRHRIGRDDGCRLALPHDRGVSTEHAELLVHTSGLLVIVDLGSRNGTFLDDVEVDDHTVVPLGSIVTVGTTDLRVSSGPASRPDDAAPEGWDDDRTWAGTAPPEWDTPDPPPPTSPTRAPTHLIVGTLVASLVALVASLGLSPLGTMGVRSVAGISAAVLALALAARIFALGRHDELDRERDTAAAMRRWREDLDRAAVEVQRLQPGPPAVHALVAVTGAIDRDVAVRVGLAQPRAAHAAGAAGDDDLADALGTAQPPCFVRRRASWALGRSEHDLGVARWTIVQRCAFDPPERLALVVVTDEPRRWAWSIWLPHVHVLRRGPWGSTLITPAAAPGDLPRLFEAAGHRGMTTLLVWATGQAPPAALAADVAANRESGTCDLLVVAGQVPTAFGPIGLLADVASSRDGRPLGRRDELDEAAASRAARHLWARCDATGWTPAGWSSAAVDLIDIVGSVGHDATGAPGTSGRGIVLALGEHDDRPMTVDLVRDGPHVALVGPDRSAVDDLLATVLAGVAVGHAPSEVQWLVLDRSVPVDDHPLVRDRRCRGWLDMSAPEDRRRALRHLATELERRQTWAADPGPTPLAPVRLLVVVTDLFGVQADDDLDDLVVRIARLGRALGLHLVVVGPETDAALGTDLRSLVEIVVEVSPDGEGSPDDLCRLRFGGTEWTFCAATANGRGRVDGPISLDQVWPPPVDEEHRDHPVPTDLEAVLVPRFATDATPVEVPRLRPFPAVIALGDVPRDAPLDDRGASGDGILIGAYDDPGRGAQGRWHLHRGPGLVVVDVPGEEERMWFRRAVRQAARQRATFVDQTSDADALRRALQRRADVIVLDDLAELLDPRNGARAAVVEALCSRSEPDHPCVVAVVPDRLAMPARIRRSARSTLLFGGVEDPRPLESTLGRFRVDSPESPSGLAVQLFST